MTRLAGARSEEVAAVAGPPPLSAICKLAAGRAGADSSVGTQASRATSGRDTAIEPAAPSFGEALEAAARQIESYLQSVGRALEFRVDGSTGRTVISVRDAQTGELIRQIPSEEALRLAQALGTQSNVLIDLFA